MVFDAVARRKEGLEKWLDAWVMPDIPKDSEIIDVGCGIGHGIDWLKSAGYENVIGFDVEDSLKRNDITIGDMRKLTLFFEIGRFDAIISSHSLEHIAEPDKALSEWKRVLKDNGMVFVVLPYPDNIRKNPLHVGRFTLGTNIDDGAKTLQAFFKKNGWQTEATKFDSFREREVWLKLRKASL